MGMSLEALLNRVGKRVFVQYYEQFRDTRLPAGDVVALLPREFTAKSRSSRTSKARRIFREDRATEALRVIAASGRVETDVAEQARQLLAQLTGSGTMGVERDEGKVSGDSPPS